MVKLTLGIIGGGQLGSMLASAAKKINIETVIFSDDQDAPAQKFSDAFVFGKYNNEDKINEFVEKVDIVTFEFENIPFETLNKINKIKKVLPKPSINKIIQHRLYEKDFINKCNLKTTLYDSVKNDKELKSKTNFVPSIIKTCTLGYDGKGQYKINSLSELDKINLDSSQEYIIEKLINLKKEISVIVTRFGNQKYEIYEPIENVHEDQILKNSKIPAEISNEILNKSKNWAKIISEELDYIGTLCVEFFIDKKDNLYVNEIAPRVHNSGHLTINSHNISQFENHIRAVCALEKKETKKLFNAKMINLIGNDILVYRNKKYSNDEFFFDYLKKKIKPKRKMGHLTVIKKII
jgi:5-(carboxyamino)imidazole ribonucleotide synthase